MIQKRILSYWDQGEARPFVASQIEVGLYVKPQISVGYGLPYWINTIAEVFAITTTSFGGVYGGIRGTLPFLDVRIGTRYTWSYHRSFLPPQAHYVSDDVTSSQGRPLAHYLSLETELTGIVPLLNGYLVPVITIYNIPNTPEGMFVFDESLRGITDPPWIMGFRLAYAHNFGRNDFIKAGVLTELVTLGGRSDTIFRMGPAAVVSITDHLTAQGTLSVVVKSPDSLGLFNGSFGVFGVAYRWATGDPHPAFP
jgi:hypothetical protein